MANGEGLCGFVGVRGRNGRSRTSLVRSCGVLVLCFGVRSMRSTFGGSGDQETFIFDLGVSGTKVGVVIGDAGNERYLSGEDAGERDFCGELGAVSKTSSSLASESPIGTTRDSEAIF